MDVNTIIAFCKSILRHLEEEMEEYFETNQQWTGMKETFCGHIVRDWQGVNLDDKNTSS